MMFYARLTKKKQDGVKSGVLILIKKNINKATMPVKQFGSFQLNHPLQKL
jgi:hypothetical protein